MRSGHAGRSLRLPVVLALAAGLLLASCRSSDGGGGVARLTPTPTPTPTSRRAAPPTTASPPGLGVVVTPAGVVLPVVSEAGGRRHVRTPCGQERPVAGGTLVARADIVLDPGHGGNESGAVGAGGLAESALNLAVARRARTALEAQGVSALLTRDGDHDADLPSRAMTAAAVGARALVSVHHNAEPDGPHAGPGTETYYQQASAESKRLAGLVQEEVVRALSSYRVEWVGDTDAGAKYRPGTRGDYYGLLRLGAPITSVLAELAFLSDPPEAALLARPDVQAAEGDAVARGIVRWLRTDDPGSGFTTPYPRIDPPGTGGVPRCVDLPLPS